MYADRFVDVRPSGDELSCSGCERVLGNRINYKKEDGIAYRLYVGAVKKKAVRRDSLAD